MEHLQEIVTSIESPHLLSENVHRNGRKKDTEGDSSASDEHQSWAVVGNPIVEEVGEAEEHDVLEGGGRNECLH